MRGFSLIELMVVIAIIAVLAAVAIPAYKDHMIRARMMKAIVLQEDVHAKIIEAYNDGTWNCSTTTFNYNGVNLVVNGTHQNISMYPDNILSTLELGTSFSPYTCGDTWFAFVGTYITGIPSDADPNTSEMWCMLGKNNAGVNIKLCGVWNGALSWQVSPKYLPEGWDCFLDTNTTVRGTACATYP